MKHGPIQKLCLQCIIAKKGWEILKKIVHKKLTSNAILNENKMVTGKSQVLNSYINSIHFYSSF